MADLPDPSRIGAWADLPFFAAHWPEVRAKLAADTRPICPPAHQVFRALELTQPDDVRVLILGQDPYPTPGHAHGLAFSVTADTRPIPRSLGNIFKEMKEDLGISPTSGDLSHWAQQGVLLLNTALTTPAGDAGGHLKLGWDRLLSDILTRLDREPRALLLWGKPAQKLAAPLSDHHFRIATAHPSPLSARRGFFASRPFSRVNLWLDSRGAGSIEWVKPETAMTGGDTGP